jgi:hypothetical protein
VSDPDGPEYLAPAWTYALGGPSPEPDDQDDQPDPAPELEPVPESDTMRRLREQMARFRHQH